MMIKNIIKNHLSPLTKTSLSNIINEASVLLESNDIPSKHKEKLHLISSSGKDLLSTINDCLDIMLMKTNEFIVKEAPLNISNCIDNAIEFVKPIYWKMNKKINIIKILHHINDDITIISDEKIYTTIFVKLLTHSLKTINKTDTDLSSYENSNDVITLTLEVLFDNNTNKMNIVLKDNYTNFIKKDDIVNMLKISDDSFTKNDSLGKNDSFRKNESIKEYPDLGNELKINSLTNSNQSVNSNQSSTIRRNTFDYDSLIHNDYLELKFINYLIKYINGEFDIEIIKNSNDNKKSKSIIMYSIKMMCKVNGNYQNSKERLYSSTVKSLSKNTSMVNIYEDKKHFEQNSINSLATKSIIVIESSSKNRLQIQEILNKYNLNLSIFKSIEQFIEEYSSTDSDEPLNKGQNIIDRRFSVDNYKTIILMGSKTYDESFNLLNDLYLSKIIKIEFPINEQELINNLSHRPVILSNKIEDINIILAEDDHNSKKVEKDMLKLIGFKKVSVVKDGKMLMYKLKKYPMKYGILVLDIIIPKINGFDCIKLINQGKLDGSINSKLKIIVISAISDINRITDLIKNHSIDYFVPKPIDLPLLRSCIFKSGFC